MLVTAVLCIGWVRLSKGTCVWHTSVTIMVIVKACSGIYTARRERHLPAADEDNIRTEYAVPWLAVGNVML